MYLHQSGKEQLARAVKGQQRKRTRAATANEFLRVWHLLDHGDALCALNEEGTGEQEQVECEVKNSWLVHTHATLF